MNDQELIEKLRFMENRITAQQIVTHALIESLQRAGIEKSEVHRQIGRLADAVERGTVGHKNPRIAAIIRHQFLGEQPAAEILDFTPKSD